MIHITGKFLAIPTGSVRQARLLKSGPCRCAVFHPPLSSRSVNFVVDKSIFRRALPDSPTSGQGYRTA
jgi:hypothetical protein